MEISPVLKNLCSYLYDNGFGYTDVYIDRLYRKKDFTQTGANIVNFEKNRFSLAGLRGSLIFDDKKRYEFFLRGHKISADIVFAVDFPAADILNNIGFDLSKVVFLSLEGIDYMRRYKKDYVRSVLSSCRFCVTQSAERGLTLKRYLNMDIDFEYLPITQRPRALKEKKDSGRLNIVYSGYLAEWACLVEFLEAFKRSGSHKFSNLTLQGHAMTTQEYLGRINDLIRIIPNSKVDGTYYEEEPYMDFLSGQDAGIAFYRDLSGTGNFANMASASGKIASYLWSGLAVLTNIDEEVTKSPPFIHMRDFSEGGIEKSLGRVRENKELFQKSAYELAVANYNFDAYMGKLTQRLG
jgi:hypothetical protein